MSSKPDLSEYSGECDLLIIAGEASGDEHAARLVEDLLAQRPGLKIAALGGEELRASGAQFLFPLADHAVVGIVEVLKNYGFFKNLFEGTLSWIKSHRPKCVLLVDYPGFNLRLARAMSEQGLSEKGGGDCRVLQYVSPQLWAWKPKRRFLMSRVLDGLGILFPFEKTYYEDTGLPVSFVGHPFAHPRYQSPVSYDPKGCLLMLPGSRAQPIGRILPVFLDAYERLRAEGHDIPVVIPTANPALRELVESILVPRKKILPHIEIVDKKAKLRARAALMSSGTMSLACAWAGIPGVIGYRAHPLTYLLGKMLVGVPHLGMANLLLPDDPPNPEYLQGAANGKQLAGALSEMLHSPGTAERANATSEKLRNLLGQSKDSELTDWVLQAGKLD